MKHLLILLLAGLFGICKAYPQLVNIEDKRKSGEEGFHGIISLSIDLKQNTKKIFQGKNGIGLYFKKDAHTVMAFNNVSFMQVDDDEALVNSGFQHIRYNYTFNHENKNRLTMEAFVQHQYNAIKLLERRIISGVGPRIKIWGTDTSDAYFYLAPLVMYEYEELTTDTTSEVIKGDFYISTGYKFNDHVKFNLVTYYQPAFNDFSDFRISLDAGFKFKVFKNLKFTMTYSLDYDSKPPYDVDDDGVSYQIVKAFHYLKTGIAYEF